MDSEFGVFLSFSGTFSGKNTKNSQFFSFFHKKIIFFQVFLFFFIKKNFFSSFSRFFRFIRYFQ